MSPHYGGFVIQSSLTGVNFLKNSYNNAVTYLFLIHPSQHYFNSENCIMLINASYYGEAIFHLTIPEGSPLYETETGVCGPKGSGFRSVSHFVLEPMVLRELQQ